MFLGNGIISAEQVMAGHLFPAIRARSFDKRHEYLPKDTEEFFKMCL